MARTGQGDGPVRPWDPVVRITHWGIAAAVLYNGLIDDDGSQWHVLVGYAALALLALRLLWGLIGTEEARFSAFPLSLSGARAHAARLLQGEHGLHRSHGPLGAVMVYALWVALAVIITSGVAMAGSPVAALEGRPAARAAQSIERHEAHLEDRGVYGEEDKDGDDDNEHEYGGEAEEWLKELHEGAANFLLLFAALHVVAIGFETLTVGPVLLRRMLIGQKQEQGSE